MRIHLLIVGLLCFPAAFLPGLPTWWIRLGFVVAGCDLVSVALWNKPLIKPGPIAKMGHPWL